MHLPLCSRHISVLYVILNDGSYLINTDSGIALNGSRKNMHFVSPFRSNAPEMPFQHLPERVKFVFPAVGR